MQWQRIVFIALLFGEFVKIIELRTSSLVRSSHIWSAVSYNTWSRYMIQIHDGDTLYRYTIQILETEGWNRYLKHDICLRHLNLLRVRDTWYMQQTPDTCYRHMIPFRDTWYLLLKHNTEQWNRHSLKYIIQISISIAVSCWELRSIIWSKIIGGVGHKKKTNSSKWFRTTSSPSPSSASRWWPRTRGRWKQILTVS